jgi:hypothetical protein
MKLNKELKIKLDKKKLIIIVNCYSEMPSCFNILTKFLIKCFY